MKQYKGFNKSEIKQIKEIDVIEYLLQSCYSGRFKNNKDKNQLTYIDNPDFIIYKEINGITHGYDFRRNVSHPYKDNIGVLQYTLNMSFIDACNALMNFSKNKGNWNPVCDNDDSGFMMIPDGIDNVVDRIDE